MNLIKLGLFSTALSSLMAIGAGCNCTRQCCGDEQTYKDPFFPSDEKRMMEKVGRQQAASAAKADATLNSAHFHGDKLNSLGEQKLELMLQDDDTSKPVTVYLDVAEDANASGRRTSVEAFMLAHGIATDWLKLENGLNPNGIASPAAPLLKNMANTDSVNASGAPAQ